jgi:hypothetical protein
MSNRQRLTASGAWSGSVGALVGDSINSEIVALAGGANDSHTPVLKADINIIKVCAAAGDSVKLPKGDTGDDMWVRNGGGETANVFPPDNGRIDGEEIDAPRPLPSGKAVIFKSVGRADWITAN